MKELVHSLTLIFSRKKMSEELKKKGDWKRQFFYKPVWGKFSPVHYMITQEIIHLYL